MVAAFRSAETPESQSSSKCMGGGAGVCLALRDKQGLDTPGALRTPPVCTSAPFVFTFSSSEQHLYDFASSFFEDVSSTDKRLQTLPPDTLETPFLLSSSFHCYQIKMPLSPQHKLAVLKSRSNRTSETAQQVRALAE